MRDEKGHCAQIAHKTNLAEEIINEIIFCDSPQNFREKLQELLIAFLMQPEPLSDKSKEDAHFTCRVLSDALKRMELLNARKEVANVTF
jgi:hypothetical protein